jgi:hypothetical protein
VRYKKPSPDQLTELRAFLAREAREVFGEDGGNGRVFDDYVLVYDKYPRYARLKDIEGDDLILGDKFFRLGQIANTFLAATHLDHDRFGICGPVNVRATIALSEIEMTEDEFNGYLRLLADDVVRSFDADLVVELDWMDVLQHGPAIATAQRALPRQVGKSVISHDLGPISVSLVTEGDCTLLDVEGERTPISSAEANVLLNTSERRLTDWVFGPKVDRNDRLADILTRGLRQDLNAIFMDQSTFRNAFAALQDDVLLPTRLFDLSCLAHHLVFADIVVVPSTCTVPQSLQSVVIPSEADEVAMSPAMYGLGSPHSFDPNGLVEVDGLAQIQAAWTSFLGEDVVLSYPNVDRVTSSPGSWEYLPGNAGGLSDFEPADLLCCGMGNTPHHGSFQELSEAASVHTFRYMLNERRAQLMGMPYASSALRSPVNAVRLRNALHFRGVVEQLLHRAPGSAPQLGTLVQHMRLPDAFAVACAGARTRDDILPSILKLREKMTSLRDELQESRELNLTDSEVVRRLRSSVPGTGIARTADAAVVSLSSVAAATGADLGTGLLVAKLAASLNLAEKAVHFLDLIRRPHLRVIQNFNQTLANAATTEELFRLWDMTATRRWFEVAMQLSDLSPYESAKLQTF